MGLEQSLTMLVKEFEEERRVVQESHASDLEQSKVGLLSLQRRHDLQDKEMTHVKRLARRILEQRTQVEDFFLQALAHVRKEIAANRYLSDISVHEIAANRYLSDQQVVRSCCRPIVRFFYRKVVQR